MKTVDSIARDTAYPGAFTPQSILELYEATQEELQICASVKPDCNLSDTDVETKENTLLELEAHLLNAAARVKLRGHEDLQSLIDLWEKTTCLENYDDLRPADRIAMNMFRYLMSADALKS